MAALPHDKRFIELDGMTTETVLSQEAAMTLADVDLSTENVKVEATIAYEQKLMIRNIQIPRCMETVA